MDLSKRIAIVCAVLVCVAGLTWIVTESRNSGATLTYSQFLDRVRSGGVTSVVLANRESGAVEATIRTRDGQTAHAVLPADYRDALLAMQAGLVSIEIRDSSAEPHRILAKSIPFLLVLAVWVVLMVFKIPSGLKGTLVR